MGVSGGERHIQHTPRTAYVCGVLTFSYLPHAAINVFIVVKSPGHIPFRSDQPGWAKSTEGGSFPGVV